MFSLKPKNLFFPRGLLLAAGALLLAGCEGDMSGDIAQEDSIELSLQQCEVVVGGVVGTPTDPVTIDGEATQACLLDTDVGQRGEVRLKSSHKFEPLVWVLDGTYEIGESKRYATLADWKADAISEVTLLGGVNSLYAREGALVIVHRNGKLWADIESVGDGNTATGEWAGVVVNGVGPHPDCGSNASAENFCNIEGPWGYYGGLPPEEGKFTTALTDNDETTGYSGWAIEAGGEPASGAAPAAALTLNALHPGQNAVGNTAYSAQTGVEINGGALHTSTVSKGNQGSAIHWHSGFYGSIGGVIYHDSEAPALRGESAGNVELSRLTLIDRNGDAGTAIQLGGGGELSIDNVVVQGFPTCLQVEDAITSIASVGNSVFYCDNTSAPGAGGSDHAAIALEGAENFYTRDPDLDPQLEITASDIKRVDANPSIPAFPGGSPYDFRLLYEACYGVGTPLEETVKIGVTTYGLCQLSGTVEQGFRFNDAINGEPVAWLVEGNVTLGADFSGLDEAGRKARLQDPIKVLMDGESRILLGENTSIIVNPGVALTVAGTLQDPVELEARDREKPWSGITINGLAENCGSAELCELAARPLVDIDYLRLQNTGAGAALTLNQLNEATRISHLDIADAAGDALVLNGGAPNIDHLLVSEVAGSGVAWRNGYRGTLQYAILKSGATSRGHALHGRNNSADHDAAPRSRPVMASITMKGAENADTAILLEQGSGLLLYNSVVAEFDTCLDIDDQSTADLQHTDPKQIHFDNVVLDCGAGENTLAEEDEDGGFDFAISTSNQSGVYQVAAVLDDDFVANGPDIPGIESEIDLSLAGNSAVHLDSALDYVGSVRDSGDDWYLGWSDSIGVLLAAECDYKGVLEGDYTTQVRVDTYDENGEPIPAKGSELPLNILLDIKVCGLRGTITEDMILTAYSGRDAEAVANGELIAEEVDKGTVWRNPSKTRWLLNGVVHVGEGHLELTDPAQVQAMKADPVTLGIESSAIVMVSDGGGLHITRGGELIALGGEDLKGDTETDDASPISLSGVDGGTWAGLIVDGFARNNQCPDAATAEPGSRVCNIEGEFGYHGGYDDEHGNLDVENLKMAKGSLRLNSVGRGANFENFYFDLGGDGDHGIDVWGEENFGRAVIDIDGGAVNLRTVNIAKIGAGSAIRWNHGYRGNMQSVYIYGQGMAGAGGSSDPSFFETLYKDDGGTWSHFPVIRGMNGGTGHEDDLPRSMPTLANVTVNALTVLDEEIYAGREPADVRITAIELARGSGMSMHNSVVGSSSFSFGDGMFIPSFAADQCVSADSSVAALLGEEVILEQVAFGCEELSMDLGLEMKINETFESKTLVNNASSVANKNNLANPSMANADVYHFDWVTKYTSDNFISVPDVKLFEGWSYIYPAPDVINLGEAPMDYSRSQSADKDFIVETNYFGSWDYMTPLYEGEEISN